MPHQAPPQQGNRPGYLEGPLPIPESTNYVDPQVISQRLALARMLRDGRGQENVNNGTWQGALAHMINKGVGAYGEYRSGQAQEQAAKDQASNTRLRGDEMNALIAAMRESSANPQGMESPGSFGPQPIEGEPGQDPSTFDPVQFPTAQHPDVQQVALQYELDRQAQALKGQGTGGTSGVTFGDYEGFEPERRELFGDYQSKGQTAVEVGAVEAARQQARTGALSGQEDIKTQYDAIRRQHQQDIELSGIPAKTQAQSLADQKADLVKNQTQKIIDLPQIEADIETTLSTVDQLINHPGTAALVGKSGAFVPEGGYAGFDTAGAAALLKQVAGQNFLRAFESLKGGGHITEIEGLKAEQSIARLYVKQPDKDFFASLKELKQIIIKGRDRARQQAGGQQGIAEGGNDSPLTPEESEEVRRLRGNP